MESREVERTEHCKPLHIKNLINSALTLGKVVNDEYFEPFQQFFVVFESVLRHGLKSEQIFAFHLF